MAGQDQRVASIYSDIKYRFDPRSVKELKEFKKNLVGMKKGLSEIQKANPYRKTTVSLKEANSEHAKRIRLLRSELLLKNKLPQAALKDRGTIASSMAAARKGLDSGRLSPQEFDQRMIMIKDRLTSSINRQKAAVNEQKAAVASLFGYWGRMGKGVVNLQKRNELAQRAAAKAAREHAVQLRKVAAAFGAYNARMSRGIALYRKQQIEANSLSHQFKQLRSNVIALTGAYTAFAAISNVNRVGQDFERAGILMDAVLGDEAPEAMRHLRAEAKRLGVDLLSSTKSFAKYVASAGPVGYTLEEMKEQFTGLAEASVVFGLSADQQLGVIRALEQMASKGQVMAEELRLQLGDRLPGVLAIAAKSIGVTRKEFVKMMEQGEIAADTFIPAFISAMREMAQPGLKKAIESTDTAQKQMVNSFTLWKDALFVGGFDQIFEDIFTLIRDILDVTRPWVSLLAGFLAGVLEPVVFLFRLIAAVLGDITDALDYFSQKFLGMNLDEVFSMIGKALGQIVAFFFGGVVIKGIKMILGFFSGLGRFFGLIFNKIVGFFKMLQNNPVYKFLTDLFGGGKVEAIAKGGTFTAANAEKALKVGMKAGVITNASSFANENTITDILSKGLPLPLRLLVDFTGKARGMLKESSQSQSTRPLQSNTKE